MLEKVKKALRISLLTTAFDEEIIDLIEEAKADLRLAGVYFTLETDPLIERAIKTYCKSNFGFDNPDADRFQDSYIMLKQHLCLSADYKEVVL